MLGSTILRDKVNQARRMERSLHGRLFLLCTQEDLQQWWHPALPCGDKVHREEDAVIFSGSMSRADVQAMLCFTFWDFCTFLMQHRGEAMQVQTQNPFESHEQPVHEAGR